eukprot:480535_1
MNESVFQLKLYLDLNLYTLLLQNVNHIVIKISHFVHVNIHFVYVIILLLVFVNVIQVLLLLILLLMILIVNVDDVIYFFLYFCNADFRRLEFVDLDGKPDGISVMWSSIGGGGGVG